jgi:hypothetical protein
LEAACSFLPAQRRFTDYFAHFLTQKTSISLKYALVAQIVQDNLRILRNYSLTATGFTEAARQRNRPARHGCRPDFK